MNIGETVAKLKSSVKEHQNLLAAAGTATVIALLVFYAIGYNMGVSKTVDKQLLELKQQADQTYNAQLAEIDSQKQKIEENNAVIKEIEEYVLKKDSLTKELEDVQKKTNELRSSITSLDSDIKVKQIELDKLTANVTKAAGAPITLPAGTFTVGKHLPAGRYKITGSSNLIAEDGSINIILGSRYGVSEYVTDLENGVVLNCRGSDTFTPLEY